MATKYFTGGATAVADVWTLALSGTLVAAEWIDITYTGYGNTIKFTAATTVLATFAAAIAEAWNDLDEDAYPETKEYTAEASGDNVVFTHVTPGVGAATFVVDHANMTGSAAFTHTTTSTGPYHYDNVLNWAGGVAPAAGDAIVFAGANRHVRYGMTDTDDMTEVNVDATWTGHIGLPDINSSLAVAFPEWRTKFAALGTSTAINWLIGQGVGDGSPLLRIDHGANTGLIWVYKTAASDDETQAACIIKGGSSCALAISGGEVEYCRDLNETGSAATINVSQASDDNATTLWIGSGAGSCTRLTVSGGATVHWDSGTTGSTISTVYTYDGSTFNTAGTVIITTFHSYGGASNLNSTGTITTINAMGDSDIDFTGFGSARTVTTLNCYPGCTVSFPVGGTAGIAVTVTNFKRKGGNPALITINAPPVYTIVDESP